MVREARRVRVASDDDLRSVVDAVHADKEPRIVEEDGEAVAAVVSIEDLRRLSAEAPSRRDAKRALAAAGAWKGLVPDDFGKKLSRFRHESPPSPPVHL